MNEKNLIWSADLDNRYYIYVERVKPYTGELVVMDNDKEIYRKPVTISYDAKFGPDMIDINTWEDMVIKFIDGEYNK